MLRTRTFSLLLLLLAGSLLAYGTTITLFQAVYDDTNARVEWEVTSEDNIQEYEVARKANNEPAFSRLATVTPSDQLHYQFLDQNVYRSADAGPFTYRLTVRTATGEQQYQTVLSQAPSAMQRSWSSIKQMFR